MADKMYTLKEVADILKESPSTLGYRRDQFAQYVPRIGTDKRRYTDMSVEVLRVINDGFKANLPHNIIEEELKKIVKPIIEQYFEEQETPTNVNEYNTTKGNEETNSNGNEIKENYDELMIATNANEQFNKFISTIYTVIQEEKVKSEFIEQELKESRNIINNMDTELKEVKGQLDKLINHNMYSGVGGWWRKLQENRQAKKKEKQRLKLEKIQKELEKE